MTTTHFNEKHFSNFTDTELIEIFNKEVGNNGGTSSRAEFLSLLHEEFNKRGFDYSIIGDEKKLSLKNRIELLDKKIIFKND